MKKRIEKIKDCSICKMLGKGWVRGVKKIKAPIVKLIKRE